LLPEGPAIEALEFLRELGSHLHPASGDSDPIAISDLMAETDEIIYVPLMFGYSNYARKGFSTHRLRFDNAPAGESGRRGSVLGGVGIALSAQSRQPELAADLARLVASESVQQTTYVEAGGQPGHLKAWQSAKANELVAGFFENTIATMHDTFTRPRIPGHRRFQQEAGAIVHSCIWSRDLTPAKCFERLQIAVERHL
jgi:multiple sugar transport system substrate-binding protein